MKCSEGFPELWEKVKQLLLGFPTTYFAEQGFCQLLHTRNKYRNNLDIEQDRGIAILKLTNRQLVFQKT